MKSNGLALNHLLLVYDWTHITIIDRTNHRKVTLTNQFGFTALKNKPRYAIIVKEVTEWGLSQHISEGFCRGSFSFPKAYQAFFFQRISILLSFVVGFIHPRVLILEV